MSNILVRYVQKKSATTVKFMNGKFSSMVRYHLIITYSFSSSCVVASFLNGSFLSRSFNLKERDFTMPASLLYLRAEIDQDVLMITDHVHTQWPHKCIIICTVTDEKE